MRYTALAREGVELYVGRIPKSCRKTVTRVDLLRRACANYVLVRVLRFRAFREPYFSKLVECLKGVADCEFYQ